MVMKRPPVMIPTSGRVPERDSGSPRLDLLGDGGSISVSWKISLSPMFLGKRQFIGKEAVPGAGQGHQAAMRRGWALGHAIRSPAGCGPPLRLFFGLSLLLGE